MCCYGGVALLWRYVGIYIGTKGMVAFAPVLGKLEALTSLDLFCP